ncbi:hypothetical protein [Geomicrobium sediminis]|uniref:Uncharacterized protein n=1 Tax=Geomicrobium sediminis TaxID=1347788 RepID=A0ABS2PGQ2_9BACL|nr:hypothetical protein [Geomicrobium sediminis]MBM7634210.1 hypothetical protein [Geomicrobium sediminis]
MGELIIPEKFIKETIPQQLGEEFITLFHEYYQMSLTTYIERIIQENFTVHQNPTMTDKYAKELKSKVINNSRQKKKRRWLSTIRNQIKNPTTKRTEILADIDNMNLYMQRFGSSAFQRHFQAVTVEEATSDILEEIEAWAKDPSKKMSDYRYIREKHDYQIKAVLESDLIVEITEILTSYPGGIKGLISEEPDAYITNPVSTPKKITYKRSQTLVDQDGEQMELLTEKDFEQNESFQVLFGSQGSLELDAQRAMDPIDREVFGAIINHRSANFLKTRIITVKLGELVRDVHGPRKSSKYYQGMRNRLAKLRSLTFRLVQEGKETAVFGFLDKVQYYDEDSTEIAEITINSYVHQQFVERQTTKIYSEMLQGLSNNISRSIVFILQKERFAEYSQESIALDEEQQYDYGFFNRRITFNTRNQNSNMDIIELAMQEIMSNNICIKDYRRVQDVFYVKFLPITDTELADLGPIKLH